MYGRKFTLYTDHKPLTTILGSKQGIPPLAAARLQRWALILSGYEYKIVFKSTKAHANADRLSRLPVSTQATADEVDGVSLFNISQIHALPVTAAELQRVTRQDSQLGCVFRYTQNGWPEKVTPDLKPYWFRRTVEGGCLMWGIRVVVPEKLRGRVLDELHHSHAGIVKTKSLARSYVWWPGLDAQIENLTRSCETCQAARSAPMVAPLHPWTWPARPWQRININFAGPFHNRMFLIVVDAHSRWPEVIEMKSTTSTATIQELRRLFASYGLPLQVVSDNGPQFASSEFKLFMKGNGIKHIRCAPYHPSSNGAAERFVQSFKRAMKASEKSNQSFQQRLMNFLLSYRSTPHSTTNVTPCSLFLNRQVRTRFDLLRPSTEEDVAAKQADQKLQHDQHAKPRELFLGQRVLVRNIRPGQAWIPGTVVERNGPLSYLVQVSGNRLWKRHIDHIREMNDSPQQLETGSDDCVLPVPTTMTPAIPSPLVAPVNPPVTIPTETADQSLISQPRETETRDARETPQDSDRSTTPVITSPKEVPIAGS